MIKVSIFKCVLIVLTLFPMACSADNKMVLEQKDIQFFKADEVKDQKAITLRISGLAFHSSLAVSSIKTQVQEASLLVFIFLTPAREGISGSFSYEVSVPDTVRYVRFGNEKIVIWERK